MQASTRTLRVGLVIDRWQPSRGGAEQALSELARHLESRGHEVIAFAEEGPMRGETAPGRLQLVRARGFALTRGARERRLADAALDAARRAGCAVTVGVRHVAHADLCWPHGGSHAASIAAWRAASAWRVDRPSTIGLAAPRGRHRAFVEIEREAYAQGGARAVACVSELVRRELASAFPGAVDRLRLVENGVDLERFHPRERATSGAALRRELGIPTSTALVAFAARNPVLKGLPVLFAALARLQDHDWTLVAAGSRDVNAWKRRARAAGIPDERVRVLRDVDTRALLAAADVSAAPTWRDTSGLIVLEALASGTPVVATAQAGASDLVTPAAGEILERPGDVEALTRALALRLAAARAGEPDRAAIRACVEHRGRDAWLARIEALLLELGA